MRAKGSAAFALAALFALTAASCSAPKPHERHVWSEWTYFSEEEHIRVCKADGCSDPPAVEREAHTGHPCPQCASFKAVAFYTGNGADQAHDSFVAEANEWFLQRAEECNFFYEATQDWSKLNDEFLAECDAVIFLDTRPEEPAQREAFERYMENGGGWMGFHFSAFALTPSQYDQNWDWYHNEFLGSGQYADNTWEPTAETIRVETHDHPATANLPDTFLSAPCEWYSWERDLRQNPDITVLASLDASTFPVGTNRDETWYEGDYPVVWTNNNYKMIYFNMGHNLVNYGDHPTDRSHTFDSEEMGTFVLDGLFGIADE